MAEKKMKKKDFEKEQEVLHKNRYVTTRMHTHRLWYTYIRYAQPVFWRNDSRCSTTLDARFRPGPPRAVQRASKNVT